MKVKIVGDGKLDSLTEPWLIIGKEYDCEQIGTGSYWIVDEEGDTVCVNVEDSSNCGFLRGAIGNLKWEFVEEQQ